ncbi:hypothetical protein PUN28_006362 [Cardiocondyla obscurior]|uniref:SHSP domain-containing protein n=1 Tax=Cardiocondyla obscurior TaxID=286306 RepID=A0AAW2GB70_9HYME
MYFWALLLSALNLGLCAPFVSQLEANLLGLNRLGYDSGIMGLQSKSLSNLLNSKNYVTSKTEIDDDDYKIIMKMQNFKPEDITVKVKDQWVIVEAKQEINHEGNIMSRMIHKQYLVPNNVDLDQMTHTMSDDGVLTIIAKLKPENDKVVQTK